MTRCLVAGGGRADAVRYLRRLRLKKAAMAFREGMKILEQEARSFAR